MYVFGALWGITHSIKRPTRFTEMPTNKFVESAFWNFDAMFVPQQHPAREMQDTFYVKGDSPAIHVQ
jgi:phenylalanyl-tRNA synthetase alpha subunit